MPFSGITPAEKQKVLYSYMEEAHMCNKMCNVPTLNQEVKSVCLMEPGSPDTEKERASARYDEVIRKFFQR